MNKLKDPQFSIIIPTYNRAGLIKATINSVLNQTYKNFEVIVVDDGSTDNTSEVIGSFVDPRLRYHFKKNEERGAARNAGASLAGGRYLTFLDSDDLVYEHHLETALIAIANFKEPEIFHLGYEIVDTVAKTTKKIDTMPQVANELLPNGNQLSCDGIFVRHDIAERFPFNPDRELSGTEDYELWLRLASRFPIYCDNTVTSSIIQHEERSVVTTNPQKLVKRIELLEKYLLEDEVFVRRYEKQIPKLRANLQVYIALHLALMKDRRLDAIRHLLASLLLSPKALQNRAFYGTIKHLLNTNDLSHE